MPTIEYRGDSYRITVSCGYDINGKQLKRKMTWKPSPGMTKKQIDKELERQKVLFEERVRSGQYVSGDIKFVDFAERWFNDYAEKQLRPKTLERYHSMMPRINEAIGHIRLDRLKPNHILAFCGNLEEKGIREDTKYHCKADFKKLLDKRKATKAAFSVSAGVSVSVLDSITQGKNIAASSAKKICAALEKPINELFIAVGADETLSDKTILHYFRLISAILSTAVQWQVIISNPCERVKPPKVERKEPKYLDEVEAARLLELLEAEDIQNRTMIKTLLFTGMRRGELLGLEWSDIDFDNRIINICRSTLYLPSKGIFEDETKNRTSERVIKCPETVFDALQSFRAWQNEQKLKAADRWHNTRKLFTTWDGNPLHPDTLSGWFRDFIKRNGLPDVSIHSLRHTNATLQIAGGVPVTTVSSRLGHATPATTTRIYAHAIKSADEAAADTLQNILAPSKNRNKTG